ncbi:MAG TPA: response regulator [Gammaproteobacteria bacterium]|nr:response regulator [Gammaproteobacteria bacterium]
MNDDLKVLIVDDEPINLDILEEMLEENYQTCIAQSGEEALKKVESFLPDLVLLDVMMPGLNGYETCIKLRKIPKLESTNIVMVSAKAGKEDIKKGIQSGADEYVIKPFEEDTLLEIIERYV